MRFSLLGNDLGKDLVHAVLGESLAPVLDISEKSSYFIHARNDGIDIDSNCVK